MMWMKERLNEFNKFNLTPEGHLSRFGWPETARAAHSRTAAREAAGGGERICFVDNMGHMFGVDWLSEFLSFYSLYLNYFGVNYFLKKKNYQNS